MATAGTVFLFLASCYVTGSLILRPADRPGLPLLQAIAGAALWSVAIGALVHFPVNYPAVYLALMAATFCARPAVTRECLRRIAGCFQPASPGAWPECLALGLSLFPVLCHLAIVLKPEMGADALAVHLNVPAWVAWSHSWHFDQTWLSWSLMPMGADWLYTAVYLSGGEYAARLLNFCFMAMVVQGVYSSSRRFLDRGPALIVMGLMASTPLVQLVTGTLLVENVQAALILGAFVALDRYREGGEAAFLRAIMLLSGAALATKLGSFAFVAPILALAVWEMRRRKAPAWVALWALPGSVPYLYAWAKTGNPIFPFMNNVFKAKWFDATQPFVDRLHTTPLTLATPWRMLFETRIYLESHDGALGLYLPLVAALALVAGEWPRIARAAFAVSLISCLITFRTVAYVRYVYAALPLILIGFAAAARSLESDRRAFRAAFAVLAVVVGIDTWLLPTSGWYHGDFFLNPFDRRAAEAQILIGNPARRIIEVLNRNHSGETVAFFGSGDIAGLHARAYMIGWHTEHYSLRVISLFREAAYGRIAQDYGIRLFVVPVEWVTAPGADVLRRFFADYTEPEFRYGQLELRHLKPGAEAQWAEEEKPRQESNVPQQKPPAPAPAAPGGIDGPPCDPALVDDTSPRIRYTGNWRKVDHFGNACGGGTLTFTGEAGAEATFEFSGESVTWVFTKSVNRGQAEVLIDGVSRGVQDLYSPCPRKVPGCYGIIWHSRMTFGGLTPGRHVLTIRVLHRKAAPSEAYEVDVDGFSVP